MHEFKGTTGTTLTKTTYAINSRGAVRIETQEDCVGDLGERVTEYLYTPAPAVLANLHGGLVLTTEVAQTTNDAVTTLWDYYTTAPHVGLVRAVTRAKNTEVEAMERLVYDANRNPETVHDAENRTTEYTHEQTKVSGTFV